MHGDLPTGRPRAAVLIDTEGLFRWDQVLTADAEDVWSAGEAPEPPELEKQDDVSRRFVSRQSRYVHPAGGRVKLEGTDIARRGAVLAAHLDAWLERHFEVEHKTSYGKIGDLSVAATWETFVHVFGWTQVAVRSGKSVADHELMKQFRLLAGGAPEIEVFILGAHDRADILVPASRFFGESGDGRSLGAVTRADPGGPVSPVGGFGTGHDLSRFDFQRGLFQLVAEQIRHVKGRDELVVLSPRAALFREQWAALRKSQKANVRVRLAKRRSLLLAAFDDDGSLRLGLRESFERCPELGRLASVSGEYEYLVWQFGERLAGRMPAGENLLPADLTAAHCRHLLEILGEEFHARFSVLDSVATDHGESDLDRWASFPR